MAAPARGREKPEKFPCQRLPLVRCIAHTKRRQADFKERLVESSFRFGSDRDFRGKASRKAIGLGGPGVSRLSSEAGGEGVRGVCLRQKKAIRILALVSEPLPPGFLLAVISITTPPLKR